MIVLTHISHPRAIDDKATSSSGASDLSPTLLQLHGMINFWLGMLLCITFLSQPEKKRSKRRGAFTEQEMDVLREHFSTYLDWGEPGARAP